MRGNPAYRPPGADVLLASAREATPGRAPIAIAHDAPQVAGAEDMPVLSFFDGLADARELAVWGAWREGRT